MRVYELTGVRFGYDRTPVLEEVTFSVEEGDYIGIIGENGSGKTTLLRLLTGECRPDAGEIRLFGKAPEAKGAIDWGGELRRVGYVPQINPAEKQNFPIRCEELVALGVRSKSRGERRRQVEEQMERLGILSLARRNYHALSGGQKQRVQIAKALVAAPEVLLLDEPTTGVDAEARRQFFELLDHLNAAHSMTILMVTHDTAEGRRHWKRTLRVVEGVVESC